MPLASSDGAVASEGPPRGRVAAANAFAAALADEYGSERDEITPPTTSLPNEDAWREQASSDSDSEYEVPDAPRARKPDAFDRVAGGVGTVARGFWSATLIGPLVARNVFLLNPGAEGRVAG